MYRRSGENPKRIEEVPVVMHGKYVSKGVVLDSGPNGDGVESDIFSPRRGL
jgi:hypothetical protein